jgi:hypothetical protein
MTFLGYGIVWHFAAVHNIPPWLVRSMLLA